MKKILVIDDHPMIVEGYMTALQQYLPKEMEVTYNRAFSFSEARTIIDNESKVNDFFDYALVDFSLPIESNSTWANGGDIVMYLKKVMPECKSIIITGHTEVVTIYDIVKNINPVGLVTKGEITPFCLAEIIKEITESGKFRSKVVKQCIGEIVEKEILYDDYNRAILVLLSKGHKLQDLDQHLPLSLPTIKKRIAKMKQIFEVSDTAALVQMAIKDGFV
ncbi:MAG: DNA-binding response regulator [Flavobacteriaceae bacterium]|jgi:DNA-binding NarL/FixJ family response regulator|nr:DNA-binding response regulator [Flavobacteriaceae bacterium]